MEILRRLVCACLCVFSASALSQPYPNKPVKLVVAYPPGGVVDIVARTIAGPLGTALKESVVVENRSGAGGFVGHASVAKSANCEKTAGDVRESTASRHSSCPLCPGWVRLPLPTASTSPLEPVK